MRCIALCLVALAGISGCGQSDSHTLTQEKIELAMTQSIRMGLPEGTSISRLECLEDGDRSHWLCVTLRTDASNVQLRVSLAITCDQETGQCLAEQRAATALP